MNKQVESYRDLRVWQVGMDIVEACYNLTRTFPKEEIFGFTSQIRRSSASIPANVAEGYGRQPRGEYVQFLRVARGSSKELETHLLLAVRVGLTQEDEIKTVMSLCDEQGRMLTALIQSVSERVA